MADYLDDDGLELATVIILGLIRRRQRRQVRKVWVRSIFMKRKQQGEFHNLLQELRLSDPECHFQYLRMSKERFDFLLSKVGPLLTHRHYSSSVRAEISAAERLAMTICFLATGNSLVSLSFNFRVGRSTICGIVKETCEALWVALQSDYVKAPNSEDEWKSISKQFEQLWNFPQCIGVIDGKHIVIQDPENSGSTFYNYKGTHSIVLLAVCDAHYRFTLMDIGNAGCQSDGGVFSNSLFGQALDNGTLFVPKPSPLPGSTTPDYPYIIVGDEAFPLKDYLLRPYPGRYLSEDKAIFNYRLSRARRIIEKIFGILAARWRIFRRSIIAKPEKVELYVKACIALHNFLRTTESCTYCPPGFVDGEDGGGNVIQGSWRDMEHPLGLTPVSQLGSNTYTRVASEIRNGFNEYFRSESSEVCWQYRHVRRPNK